MLTRSDWTRRGLGRRIPEAFEAAATAEGFRMLALASTLPGYRLYASSGFKRLADIDVRMPDGTVVVAITMEKPVD